MSSTSTIPLDLSSAPPIFILPTHLQGEDIHEAEDAIYHFGGQLTYHATEARLFLGRLTQKKRAAFELRSKGVWTEPSSPPPAEDETEVNTTSNKRRKLTRTTNKGKNIVKGTDTETGPKWPNLENHILVLRLDWLDECLRQAHFIPYQDYIVYTGKLIPKRDGESSPSPTTDKVTYIKLSPDTPSRQPDKMTDLSIMARVQADTGNAPSSTQSSRRRFPGSSLRDKANYSASVLREHHHPILHRESTAEFENDDSLPLPPLPEWAETTKTGIYACLRSTPLQTVNAAFIAQLEKIKEGRLLTLDQIGVRAYSTSIAALAAYPHVISQPREITRLPGCDTKIATLWTEWYESASDDSERSLQVVRELDANDDLQHLRLFWNIWGVGPDTARKFYFENGWKDLDDVVEFGWHGLTRVQQIGVKFYDEFKIPIPRDEVEAISKVILHHARLCRNIDKNHWDSTDGSDMVCIIVGGHRRGKPASGDVDVILSHRDESKTRDLVVDVVASLESEAWVTHTLTLHTTTSDRGGATLPFRADGSGGGHGFDSLDKALCVWQDPHFLPDEVQDSQSSAQNNVPKNPNIHRRVDIIVSSWKTVGCAVLGWSGGTTFQRDIRRFVKRERGWKFDSSGVRDRATGYVLDLEAPSKGQEPVAPGAEGDTWLDREKRLMDRMGIGWRPATQRCTG